MSRIKQLNVSGAPIQIRPTRSRQNAYRAACLIVFRSGVFILALLGAVWLYSQGRTASFLISGTGPAHQRADLIQALTPYEGRNIFALDLPGLRQALLPLVGVGDVSLERIWPDQVRIHITPDRPIARLNQSQIITQYRNVHETADWQRAFAGPIDTARLPHFQVPPAYLPDRLDWVVGLYHDLGAELEATGLELAIVRLSQTASLHLTTTTGIEIELCRGDFSARLTRLARIWKGYLGSARGQIKRINLCYPNGLAWQPGAEPN